MNRFTHLDSRGNVRMVDVSAKDETLREATAESRISMQPDTLTKILDHSGRKGNVIETARIAGIMAAKRTGDLIPMCHPIPIDGASIEFLPDEPTASIGIRATVRTTGKTGVEMEALTAASVAALTIYDMCKSHDRGMEITDTRLVRKSGGKSGVWERCPS